MKISISIPRPALKPGSVRPSRKKILLTDDDPALRQMLMRLLTAEGYAVETAANGAEALEKASATKFDLVLLDVNMPVKNGWETFEELSFQDPALPVILITARPDQCFSAMAAGVGALLEKPLDFEILFSTIRSLLKEPSETRISQPLGRPSSFRYHHPTAGMRECC